MRSRSVLSPSTPTYLLHSHFIRATPRSFFHASTPARKDGDNHYETLGVLASATPAEIKKSFYTLSKTHHPDHNPDDPGAAKRFIQVAEAYAVLGSPERKGRYDRDLQRSSPSHARGTAARHGSHSSTAGPAGGRPASGLSRRRSQFRGPPPSFYRSGGWGEQSSKRRAQANAGTSSSSSSSSSSPHANSDSNASPSSSSSTKQDPTADYDNQEYDPLLSHFDRVSHKRTQEEQDRRRRRRMAEDFVPVEPDPGALVNFLFVGGVLTLAVVLPFLALGGRGGL